MGCDLAGEIKPNICRAPQEPRAPARMNLHGRVPATPPKAPGCPRQRAPGSVLPPESTASASRLPEHQPFFSLPDPCLLPAPQDLATPQAFARNPSQVWEFYHYRREVVQSKEPNAGHLAIAECQARLHGQGRQVVVITQNIDELHRKAGTKNLLEIHGERPSVLHGRGTQT